MRTYTPNGRGHLMLARLEDGPCESSMLRTAADPFAVGKRRQKLWRVIKALRCDGLVHADRWALYDLTQAGRDALGCLAIGQPVVVEHPVWEMAA